MALLNYSSKVSATQTIGEMTDALVKAGAASIAVEYDDGRAVGLRFVLAAVHGRRAFTLPVPDLDKVAALITRSVPKEKQRPYMRERAQAERVAWRILKDWLEAQLAIVEIDAAKLEQVMLPYMQADASGRTVWELYVDKQLALGSGADVEP